MYSLKIATAAFAIVAAMLSTSCSRPTLTRDEASRLLQQSAFMQAQQTKTVRLFASVNPYAEMDMDLSQPSLKAFFKRGYITVVASRRPLDFLHPYQLSLTDKAKKAVLDWIQVAASPDSATYSVVLTKRVLRQVTGVGADDRGTRAVEFVWAWVPTETGRELGFRENQRTNMAQFHLFDSGWRLDEASLRGVE